MTAHQMLQLRQSTCWSCLSHRLSSYQSRALRKPSRLHRTARRAHPPSSTHHRAYANTATSHGAAQQDHSEQDRIRNIGIIAHIDAGKTTTTERMLYYSGITRRIGSVDEGSTVTDFLPAERARGITIQAAAITFQWPPSAAPHSSPSQSTPQSSPDTLHSHTINLIDTPGHADFTFEVVRSLRVLDGAICILDGVAGVEAQTETVWQQAQANGIPRIIYVNKLDREGAAFRRTVHEIAQRLHTWPALCQIPWWYDGKFVGVGDVAALRGMRWEVDGPGGADGRVISAVEWEELQRVDAAFAKELEKARVALVEALTEYDDAIVEAFLDAEEDYLAVPASTIIASLRKSLLDGAQPITPVFAGASFRNIGVQPLLDAVGALLPSPREAPDPAIRLADIPPTTLNALLTGKVSLAPATTSSSRKKQVKALANPTNLQACALAFKVVIDAKRGPLVYVRVYAGKLTRNTTLYNTSTGVAEKAPRLLRMHANDALEIPHIAAGEIGVIAGLKHARTGDTLVVYDGPGANPRTGQLPHPLGDLHLRPIAVPPPLFFTSVEPASLAEERHLNESLALLLREDPSLSVTVDSESGQTQVAGMGELHLEIARDRLVKDFGVKAAMGKIEISYREALAVGSQSETIREEVDREIAGKKTQAACTARVESSNAGSSAADEMPQSGEDTFTLYNLPDENILCVNHPTHSRDGAPLEIQEADGTTTTFELPDDLALSTIGAAIYTGVAAALARGPTHTFPLHSTHITIDFDPSRDISRNTTPAALSTAARTAVQHALKSAASTTPTQIMEPVMAVTVTVDEASLGSVVHDLSSARDGHVMSLDAEEDATSTTAPQQLSVQQLRRVYAPPDPYDDGKTVTGEALVSSSARQIRARVPLRQMVGYLKHLRSLTGGRGTFVMRVDRFERITAPRQKALLAELRGDYFS